MGEVSFFSVIRLLRSNVPIVSDFASEAQSVSLRIVELGIKALNL
jgi:hypothetical protein